MKWGNNILAVKLQLYVVGMSTLLSSSILKMLSVSEPLDLGARGFVYKIFPLLWKVL